MNSNSNLEVFTDNSESLLTSVNCFLILDLPQINFFCLQMADTNIFKTRKNEGYLAQFSSFGT